MVELNLKIPDGYLKEESKDGFLVTRKRKEIWAVEMDLVSEVLRVCRKYGLHIFADGGTALGAIRHSGFIPWDDDIDLTMFRADYNKLCKVAPAEFKEPYYFQTEYTDPGSLRGHAQLRNSNTTGILRSEAGKGYAFNQGIFIDIFPLDYVPENKEQRAQFFAKIKKKREKAFKYARVTSRYNRQEKSLKGLVKRLVHKVLSRAGNQNPYYQDFEDFIQRYNDRPTKKVAKLFFKETTDNFIWDAEWFSGIKEVPFEFITLPIPEGYEKMLTAFFGDWRTPVRSSSYHGDVIFDTEKSYKEYFRINRENKAG